MTGEKRLLKAVFSILLILVVLSSALFIAAEVGHDCVGESCAVCRQARVRTCCARSDLP